MKYLFVIILILFLSKNNYSQSHYDNQTIEEILTLPENEINLNIACLVLAKEFYPDMKVSAFLSTIDYLADRFKYYFGKYTDPDKRIRALNTYFYQKGFWNDSLTFCYDDEDLYVTKLENKFINGYLSTRKGSCITMPMLYVLMGEKLGYPIYPVSSPMHFFARYISDNKKIKQNIEATNGGGFISNKRYKLDILIPNKAIKNGVYLRTLTKKEYIAALLNINALENAHKKNFEKAEKYLKLSMKYDTTCSEAYWNYGLTMYYEAKQLEEELWDKKQTEIQLYQSKIETGLKQADILKEQEQINTEIASLEITYEREIKAKLAEYHKYKDKAKELGIVTQYPIKFFQKQAESITRFKLKGGY